MAFVSNLARKIVFWNYPRTSWQWDVLCVLILVFIFLTPKTWFANTPFRQNHVRTVIVEVSGGKPNQTEAEQRAKEVAGFRNGTVSNTRVIRDDKGKVIRYEVDIR